MAYNIPAAPASAAHGVTASIDFHLLEAGLAVERKFVVLLEAGLAEVLGAAVVRFLVRLLDLFEVAIVNAADVAEEMRGKFSHRVLTEETRLDIHAGKAVAVGDEFCHLLVGEARADR
jgi:hypothetical protein